MNGAVTFGELLRTLRKRAGLTQSALAAAAGCSVASISALETGQRRPTPGMVSTQLAPALAAAGDARLIDHLLELAALDQSGAPQSVTVRPQGADGHAGAASTTPSDGLFGRDADIAALCQRLMNHPGRLLTLIGPPGVGKTSLARAIVRTLTPFHEDGAYTIWLGEVSDSELVAAAIVTALRIVEDTRSPATRLVDQLRSRNVLLLLDNFDDFAHNPSATTLVADVLKACPRVRILVTSRTRLKLRAEQSISVQPLDRRSAVELFVARVRAHQPSYTPTPTQQELIGELCRHLDDLPLAIELIAAHAEEMTTQELLAHLRTDRLALLGKQAAKLNAEQYTLTAALQHSYALLAPAEQRALRLMSVFDGGAGLDGVAALEIGLPVVQALADKSLVRLESVGSERRVRLLETVREYATMLLTAAGEFDDAQQRRLVWCLALAEEAAPLLHSGEQTRWLRRLEAERYNFFTAIRFSLGDNNVAAALRMVIALRHFWVARNHLAEIAPWLDIIEHEGARTALDRGLWARFLNCKGTVSFYRAHYDLAGDYFLAALTVAEEIGDRREIAYALDGLGAQTVNRGDLSLARTYTEASLIHSTAISDHWLAGIALINLGEIARTAGDIDAATAHYLAGLTNLQRAGDPYFIAVAEVNLAQIYLHQGDLAQTETMLRQALDAGLQAESAQVVASALEKLADVLSGHEGATAGRIFGLAQGVRQASGVTVQPVDQDDHNRLNERLPRLLTPSDYARAVAEGSRLEWRAIRASLPD